MQKFRAVLIRLFSTAYARGTKNYIDSQKKYELARAVLYFAVSVALFAAGYIQTGSRANLLSVVAILGCLPASKSAVSAVMFLRYKSLSAEAAVEIEKAGQDLDCLYDMVFTSEKMNYCIGHIAVRGNTVCGYAETAEQEGAAKRGEGKKAGRSGQFDENEFYRHIGRLLEMDGHKDVTVKIFKSLPRYTERLNQMRALEAEPEKSLAIAATLKSVAL